MGYRRRWVASLVVVAASAGVAMSSTAGGAASARSIAHQAQGCANHYSSHRVRGNPLLLPTAPGSDPLRGASFFVDGAAHGQAAKAIAQLVGINTSSDSDSVSWTAFEAQVARALKQHPSDAHQVALLEKIASQPEPQRFSAFSAGGSPSALAGQVQKILCDNLAADPGTVPIVSTYFLHATLKGCPTTAQIDAYMPTFHAQINAMVNAVGSQAIVFVLEEDALGSSFCMARHGSLPAWEAALRYEVDKVSTLPHAVTYVEAGYSDANKASYTWKALNRIDIRKIRGFWTNDTHINWTINEINWGDQIAKHTHGAHFVIDTADNGNGPLLNPHPGKQGIEDLCNPPGRALGPETNTNTGFKYVDAYLWTNVPGVSSGCGGGPPSGTFWVPRALYLAAHANDRIGPSPKYPSRPY